MRREVLSCKTVLAYGLTYEQASALQTAIRERKDLEPFFKDRTIWISSQGHGANVSWYVYVKDEALEAAFIKNPEHFLFELPGPSKLSAPIDKSPEFQGDVLSRNMKNYD